MFSIYWLIFKWFIVKVYGKHCSSLHKEGTVLQINLISRLQSIISQDSQIQSDIAVWPWSPHFSNQRGDNVCPRGLHWGIDTRDNTMRRKSRAVRITRDFAELHWKCLPLCPVLENGELGRRAVFQCLGACQGDCRATVGTLAVLPHSLHWTPRFYICWL